MVPTTILVVDDDPDILHLCALKLKRYGFNVLQASGSTEALQICSTHVGDIHLALVDLMLAPPVFQLRTEKLPYLRIHGHTLVNGLLETRKGLRAVLMSSHSKTTLENNGLMIGGLPFLQKPLFVETLLATIRQHVEKLPLEAAS
ncbi:MAG: response regulator [Nitrospira sp.]|mgnify:FL=1|nr:response regulator [Nitrospira sp.]